MQKESIILIGIALFLITAIPVFAEDSDLAERINDIMKNCAEDDNYHITAEQLSNWLREG